MIFARRLYGMLPRVRITDCSPRSTGWTGFAERFVHICAPAGPEDPVALMDRRAGRRHQPRTRAHGAEVPGCSAILFSGTGRMAPLAIELPRPLWSAWSMRSTPPFTALWSEGDIPYPNGQFSSGRRPRRGLAPDHNATTVGASTSFLHPCLRPVFARSNTKVIAANASEAAHVLDGLLTMKGSSSYETLPIPVGATEHYSGLHLGPVCAAPPRSADRRLYVRRRHADHGALDSLIGGVINLSKIGGKLGRDLRMTASIRAGTVAPSRFLRRLAAYPRQNRPGPSARSVVSRGPCSSSTGFTDPGTKAPFQRLGSTKARPETRWPVPCLFHSYGEIGTRTFENQRYRASGLNLTIAAITLWNTVYLSRAVAEASRLLPDTLLAHIGPSLGHISFNGDYVWPSEPVQGWVSAAAKSPLRVPRCC